MAPLDRARRLLPSPRFAAREPGAFRLEPATRIRLEGGTPAERAAAGILSSRLAERVGFGIEIAGEITGPAAPERGAGKLVLAEVPQSRFRSRLTGLPGVSGESGSGAPAAEAFELRVDPGGARILAATPAGLRYGAEALAQLVPKDLEVPAAVIRDRPALRRRGFLLDISRGRVPAVETAKRLIELLARLRYNELMLYTEHTFRFESHPGIGAGSGGFSGREIRELDAHARECGVELVPCLQTFGHMRRILEMDRYRGLAESDRRWSVSPEAPGTYPFLRELLEEYLPHFTSRWAHLNCDEPVDLGSGKSAALAARDGRGALFASHVNRVAAMARGLGKRPMIWADVLAEHPDALDRLDPDIVLADWWYEPDHDFDRVERFRRAGREFLSVAGTSSWNSLFPRLHAALPNIRGHARAARRFGASGLILTDWGDGGHFNLFGGSLFPLAAGAEAAWGDPERPEGELEAAFSEQVAGDPGGFAGSFAARLGRLHDAGFRHFNHSPLKTVFFETKPRATRRVPEKAALDRTLRQLRRLAGEAAERGLPAGQISLEWGHALDASVLAAERGLALLRYRSAADADPAEKRQLAEELVRLADRQRWLEEGFRQIWLRTSRPEGRETADALYRNAADALRRAARALAVRGRSRASTGTGEAPG